MTREERLTDRQFDVLTTLSSGGQPFCNPSTRRLLVRRRWVTAKRVEGVNRGVVVVRWWLEITELGRTALATLPRLRPSIPRGLL